MPPADDRRRRREEEYDDEDEYDDDEDDRPRRRRPRGDATGGLIPYKNAAALTAYYLGVFGVIPCLGGILGPLALIFGVLGLKHAKRYPEAHGQAHAWVGIVLGVLEILGHIAVAGLIAAAAASK